MSNYKGFISFWAWFFKGSGGKSGIKRFVDWWSLIHIVVGVILALIVPVDIKTAANSVLIPLVGILIALSFAWAGSSIALMQSTEIDKLTDYHEGGFEEYVYTYQLAILVILITMVIWALGGLEIYDTVWPTGMCKYYLGVKIVLYTMLSFTLRECWHLVLVSQYMLVVQRIIKKKKEGDSEDSGNKGE